MLKTRYPNTLIRLAVILAGGITFNCITSCTYCDNKTLNKQKDLKQYFLKHNYRKLWENSGLINYSKAHDSSDKKRHAFHEAGHIILAIKQDLPIIKAGITPDFKFNNLPQFWTSLVDFLFYTGFVDVQIAPITNHKKILMDLAGYMAEQIKFGKASYSITQDLDTVTKLLVKKSSSVENFLAYLQKYLTMVKQTLDENKDNLKKFADALLKHKTLTGKQVYDIIDNQKIVIK